MSRPLLSIASATPATLWTGKWSISTISPRLKSDKALLHTGEKHRPVHSSFEHKRCGHGASPQAAHEGDCFPMSMRRVAESATRSTAAQPHHPSVCAGFVDEHQPRRSKHALLAHPAPAYAG